MRPRATCSCMWTYHSDLLATTVPRYTSYPTAAEFDPRCTANDMAQALDGVTADEAISLYVHIPFCREICWYCACNTGAANRSARLTAYLERLGDEIRLVAARLGGRGRVGRIAFGGGSPNAIPVKAFHKLVDTLLTAFGCVDPVLSIEIDPRNFSAEWATALADHNVRSASLGVQTLVPEIQARIGRVQPLEIVEKSVDLMRRAGVRSINFDLMYGLPGQWRADLLETLLQSTELGADRLAVFGYAHVPQLIPRQRQIDATRLPDARERFGQAQIAHAFLTDRGYLPVGFDHFALPGDNLGIAARNGSLQRNFQGFTDDTANVLIGLGASAISSFPDHLLQNEKNNGRYQMKVGAGIFPVERGIRRSATDRQRARAIEQILAQGSADLFGLDGLADIAEQLQPFEDSGLIRWDRDRVILLPDALPYARVIASKLDIHRQPDSRRFSSAI